MSVDKPEKPPRFRYMARVLDRKFVRSVAPDSWIQWLDTNKIYRGIGYRQGAKIPDTGSLLVQSPYVDYYNLTWGLAPNADMPKWRWMFRARPEIRRGVDMKVSLAVGKSFGIICEKDKEIQQYVTRLMNHLNIRDALQSAFSDMLVYGQAYFEKVRSTVDDIQEHESIELAPLEKRIAAHEVTKRWTPYEMDMNDVKEMYETSQKWTADLKRVDAWLNDEGIQHDMEEYVGRETAILQRALYRSAQKRKARYQAMKKRKDYKAAADLSGVQALDKPASDPIRDEELGPETGELIELKPLDPLWMRINRDAFGNVLGFVQWGLTPIPQSIIAEKVVFLKWMPKSWAQENAYGTSILMPVQRHVSLLIQAEEDMKIWMHQYAKPMLVVNAGSEDKPYPVPALSSLQSSFQNMQPNTNVIVPGDVKVTPIEASMKATSQSFDTWTKYLKEELFITLGIPDTLMNLPGEMTRATSDVTLQAFIADERMAQELIGEQFMKQVIEPEVRRHFAYKYGDADMPPLKAVWKDILEEDRNKKVDRLSKSVGVPFESINEGRSEAGLEPLDDPKYDIIAIAPAGPMPGGGGSEGSPVNPFKPPPSKNPETNESQRTGAREEMQQKQNAGNQSAK